MKKWMIPVIVLIVIVILPKRIYRLTDGKTTIVAIQPFGHMDRKAIDSVSSAIKKIYNFHVIVLPEIALPKDAFINVKSPRYRADQLISYLWKIKPDSADYIIGLTESDISCTKRDDLGRIKQPESRYKDWGIMGLGYCPGKSCIVSSFRLKTDDEELFMERLKKVAIHELGHNLWLPHCPEKGCVMNDANETIRSVDSEKLSLCERCWKKIKS